MVAVYDADSSGSISTLCEGSQIEADRLHLASSYQYEIVMESFVLRMVLGPEKDILSERQILTTYNAFSPELLSRLLCL